MDHVTDEPSGAVWHTGERAAQARAGVAERMAAVGGLAIRDFMPEQHRAFFQQLPFIVVGSVDPNGRPTASILSGAPGFVRSPHPRLLRVAALPAEGDPLAAALHPGAALGILGIELPTRRRNRANGVVATVEPSGFTLAVAQSFGNCPQYIQRRDYLAPAPHQAVRGEELAGLDAEARALIAAADTFFVASYASGANGGIDISHRGGRPGFVDVDAAGRLTVPDYRGNRYFNTLGNLLVNPAAGLVFVDFERGDLLQVSGAVEIAWDGPAVAAFPGAERLWRLAPTAARRLRHAFPQRLAAPEFSPMLRRTGTWAEAATGAPPAQSALSEHEGWEQA